MLMKLWAVGSKLKIRMLYLLVGVVPPSKPAGNQTRTHPVVAAADSKVKIYQ
jgi:hypothetical protein